MRYSPPSTRMHRLAVLAVALVAACLLPAGADAASSGSFDDPIGDTLEFAPDLGATKIDVGDDDTITVDTRIVPRPPAYWGGCAYYVGFPPFQTCAPSNMNVTWYFDYSAGSGSVSDGGADAKVVVVPSRGQTFWESDRWDSANGKFTAGAQPAGTEDPGGVRWVLRLADLGIPRPASVSVRVVSLYKSYNGVGVLLNYTDTAGPGTVAVAGGPGSGAGSRKSRPCKRALGRANRLQRTIRKMKKRGRKGHRANRRLARLRKRRRGLLKAVRRKCAVAVADPGPPPSSAPPGCHLVTKPVLQQEGTGIYAPWVIKPEVVVECSK